jgi:hypothetical protein
MTAFAGDGVGQIRIFDEDAAEVSSFCLGTHLEA